MAIYLKFGEKKPKTVKQLLKKLYSVKYNEDTFKSAITYKDEACTEIQCGSKKNRSFGDIYEICQTYFPKVKEKEVVKELLEFKIIRHYPLNIAKIKEYKCTIIFCPTILKPVCFYSTHYFRYSLPRAKGIADKSWVQLLRKVKITSAIKLRKFYIGELNI